MKRFYSLIILLSFSSLLYYGCGCRTCNDEFVSDIPDTILEKGNKFIIEQTGENYFNSYMRIDYAESKFVEPYYEMAYRFYIPEKPFVNVYIRFSLDANGNIVESKEITGIPRCAASPEDCEFSITKEKAKEIAGVEGFEEGIKEWIIAFRWHKEMGIYVWHLLNTLTETESYSSGSEMIIDPNTGEVYEINEWIIE